MQNVSFTIDKKYVVLGSTFCQPFLTRCLTAPLAHLLHLLSIHPLWRITDKRSTEINCDVHWIAHCISTVECHFWMLIHNQLKNTSVQTKYQNSRPSNEKKVVKSWQTILAHFDKKLALTILWLVLSTHGSYLAFTKHIYAYIYPRGSCINCIHWLSINAIFKTHKLTMWENFYIQSLRSQCQTAPPVWFWVNPIMYNQ